MDSLSWVLEIKLSWTCVISWIALVFRGRRREEAQVRLTHCLHPTHTTDDRHILTVSYIKQTWLNLCWAVILTDIGPQGLLLYAQYCVSAFLPSEQSEEVVIITYILS